MNNNRKGKMKLEKNFYALGNSEFPNQNCPQNSFFIEPDRLALLQILAGEEAVNPAQVSHFTEDSEAQRGSRKTQSRVGSL